MKTFPEFIRFPGNLYFCGHLILYFLPLLNVFSLLNLLCPTKWEPMQKPERSPGEGSGNPLQDSCLENPMDRGAWQATVYGVTKSQTQLSTQYKWEPLTAVTNIRLLQTAQLLNAGGREGSYCTRLNSYNSDSFHVITRDFFPSTVLPSFNTGALCF